MEYVKEKMDESSINRYLTTPIYLLYQDHNHRIRELIYALKFIDNKGFSKEYAAFVAQSRNI